MVVECPECTTCFAVDLQQLAHIAKPTFNCSRCGSFFKQATTPQGTMPPKDLKPLTLSSSENIVLDTDVTISATQASLIEVPEKSEISPKISHPLSSPENSPENSPWSFGELENSLSKGHQLDLLSEKEISEPDPLSYEYKRYKPSLDIDSLLAEESGSSIHSAQWPVISSTTRSLNSEKTEASLPKVQDFIERSTQIKKNKKPVNFNTANAKAVTTRFSGEPEKHSGSLKTVLSVPAILCCLFLFWSFNIEKTPGIIKSFFSLSADSLASLPPNGLTLVDIQQQLSTLSTGDSMLEISGNVLNSTVESFSSLYLEARSYSKDNKEINRIIAPLDNSLNAGNINITSMLPSTLERLQKEVVSPSSTISPRMVVPFKILIPKVSDAEAWFSARVYSTKKL